MRKGMTTIEKERLTSFGKKVERLMLGKGWSGAELAREMQRLAPKGVTIGRHLPSAYIRGENEPTERNLKLMAQAFGVSPAELLPPLPGEGNEPQQFAQTTSTLDGKTRIVVDAEVDPETGLKILQLLRQAQAKQPIKKAG
jgi:transcriptional regulator with XRE-family HTH domain